MALLALVLAGGAARAADGGSRDAAADARPSPEDGDSGVLPCGVSQGAKAPGPLGIALVTLAVGAVLRRARR